MEDAEIDSKLRTLESELEEMKRRTQSFLAESTPSYRIASPSPPPDHVGLMAQLVDRTTPISRSVNESLDARLERDAQERRISDLLHALSLERTAATGERQRRLQAESDLEISRRRTSELEAALVQARELSEVSMSRKFFESEISAHRVDAERKLLHAREEISDLQTRLTAAQEEAALKDRKMHALEISAKNFQQIDEMRVEAEAAVLRLRREISDHHAKRLEAETALNQILQELDDRKSELKNMREENFRLKSENENLKVKLSSEISDNKNQKISADRLRHELKLLENKISDLQLQRTAAIRAQHDAILSEISQPVETRSPPPVLSEPSPRSELVARPPWALHEDFSDCARSEISRNLAGTGVAEVFGRAVKEEEERKEMEKELLDLNIERQTIEAWLGKIPFNSAGRTVQERKEKQSREFRLSCVDARIAQIKQTLRKRRQLI